MLAKKFITISMAALPTLIGCLSENSNAPTSPSELEIAPAAQLEPTPGVQQTNKKSPLAQLMRAITAHADSVRAALERDDGLPPYPSEVNDLFTAASTDSTLDRSTYTILAKDYVEKLKALYAVTASDRAQAYNGVVQSCATCHGSLCPGPLVVIRKMYAPLPTKAL